MFRKRASEWTPEDIRRIVVEAVPEGSEVEFKSALPTRDGYPHPWTTGREEIGDYTRNKLLEEVVAFANTYGGWLLLGIEETEEKPARAANVSPVRACADLAERLRLICRDCIDPQLPILDVVGVPTREDGAGVVVLHVPRSRMAAHRHTPTLQCYKRHADRTEKMTMREIQDLTLQVERGMAVVDRRFKERQELFANTWHEFVANAPRAFGLRATLMPLVPLYVERVYNNRAVRPPEQSFDVTSRHGRAFRIHPTFVLRDWRPVVRGAVCVSAGEIFDHRRAVFCDGTIEYSIMEREGPKEYAVNPSEAMTVAANILLAAEQFRRTAGAPGAEYGLEIEIRAHRLPVRVGGYGDSGFRERLGDFLPPGEVFPRYSVGDREDFGKLWSLIERDFWNAAGRDWREENMIDFEDAFRELMPPAS